MVSTVASVSVGVAPGFKDLGNVEPGQSLDITFYVVTSDVDDVFNLQPNLGKPMVSDIFSGQFTEPDEVSEEDFESWADFQQDYSINPNTTKEYSYSGGTINAQGKMTFSLNIPNDAEPGYHVGTVNLNPRLDRATGSGYGTSTLGLTVPRFVFRVDGNAEREVKLADLRGIRIGENEVQVIAQMRNTGTVTTSITEGNATVVENGRREGVINFNEVKLEPGEFGEITGIWRGNIEGGNYEIEGMADYRTSDAYIEGDISFTDIIQEKVEVEDPAETGENSEPGLPVWMYALVFAALASMLYAFELRAVWIFGILGSLGVTLLFIQSVVSLPIAAVLITTVASITYYGV
ncbi:MAG: hypothetical protein H8Z69_03510 [Nanohaloarchaea archaeon]|nr:hypothetical protein [Candidatus Nanohaloarchaea archaeon]